MINYTLILSIVLHAVILSVKITKVQQDNNQKKQSQSKIKIEIKQEQSQQDLVGAKDEDIYILEKILSDLQKIEKLAKEEAIVMSMLDKCETFYMGIGVVHNSIFGEISQVVPGSPADKAGIKVGDIPIGPLDIRDKYPEGTNITVSILRNGIMYEIPVTIGKICTKEKSDENKKT